MDQFSEDKILSLKFKILSTLYFVSGNFNESWLLSSIFKLHYSYIYSMVGYLNFFLNFYWNFPNVLAKSFILVASTVVLISILGLTNLLYDIYLSGSISDSGL